MLRLTFGPDAVDDIDEFIHTFAVWGEHPFDVARQWSREQMFAMPDYETIREAVRQGAVVKWFENVGTTTLQVISPGGVAVHNPRTGETSSLSGSGVIELSNYTARFNTAVEAWHRAITRCNPSDLLTAVGDGIAAIEGFVNGKAHEWTTAHPGDHVGDARRRTVPLRRKLDEWIPHMTGGKRLDPKSPFWNDFMEMQRYRNDAAIHSRDSVAAVDLSDFARRLNMFTSGIAIVMFKLHMFFKRPIPSVILRAAYAPEVRVVEVSAG